MFLAVFLIVGLFCVQMAAAATDGWVEYPTNPVFAPGKAYYPSVLYDANKFSGHGDSYYYKMWYYTGSPSIRLAYSNDGINWVNEGGDLGVLTNAAHPVVLYDAGGFGGSGYYYKIWYWDGTQEGPGAIRYAESTDGIHWTNDQAIGQDSSAPLVTGLDSDYGTWFYHSYGPGAVLYNPSGYTSPNTADPMGNKYVMYYDAASESATTVDKETIENTALAISADGITWTRYGSEPVFEASGGSLTGSWDSRYAYVWTVLKIDGQYQMWYSGGQGGSNAGMGYAESTDGITWTKQVDPVMSVSDGIAWRSDRTYTPLVLYDENQFGGHGDTAYYKMWYTGVDVTDSYYAVGYACIPTSSATPEYPLGDFAGLLGCLVALVVFKSLKSPRSLQSRLKT